MYVCTDSLNNLCTVASTVEGAFEKYKELVDTDVRIEDLFFFVITETTRLKFEFVLTPKLAGT
jgi:hypothetical protein